MRILRDYQVTIRNKIRAEYAARHRAVLLSSPTGSGKSSLLDSMLNGTNMSTLILCHRAELLEMISESLTVPHAIIGGSTIQRHARIQVGMMQTVSRRLDKLPPFQWVISDEAHLAMAPTWRSILEHYAGSWRLGMSATPCRLDGQGLGDLFPRIVHGPTIHELTSRGFLSPCRVFAPLLSTEEVKKSGGDFNMEAAAHALDRPAITGNAIAHYQRLTPGRRAIVFCCNRIHADHVAEEFRAAGIPAANVDGSMPAAERAQKIGAFRAGRIQVLTNVDLLTTGFDCPQIEVGIFLRPTQSLALYLQMVGRILRISPGKAEAVLLDHVGNSLRHGLPEQPREWTLEGREKRSTVAAVRQCGSCYAVFSPAPKCPSCGTLMAVAMKPRKLERRDGELVEVDTAAVEKHQAVKRHDLNALTRECRTLADLQALAKRLGYKPQWAWAQWQMRQRYRARRAA